MSKGEIVPDVITTLLKRSKTGFIASEGSRHLDVSNYSIIVKSIKINRREVKNGIWYCRNFSFKRLEDEEKS